MDGNGRWAQKKRKPRFYGHIKGSQVARSVIKECGKVGIKYLTLFVFSTENWTRPFEEVSLIMKLLEKSLEKEKKNLMRDNVCFRAIGELQTLPPNVLKKINELSEVTSKNTGLNLTFAVSYGGRQDITFAMKKIGQDLLNGIVSLDQINEDLITQKLKTYPIPDPDFVIRTSGEFRISNFLLWQSAYSEFYFTPVTWPEFSLDELHKALLFYSQRERRFGNVTSLHEDQTEQSTPLSNIFNM
jgi:undecaprenyl diphosphate synthase